MEIRKIKLYFFNIKLSSYARDPYKKSMNEFKIICSYFFLTSTNTRRDQLLYNILMWLRRVNE